MNSNSDQKAAEEAIEEINRKISLLQDERSKYFKGIDHWVCIAGQDCLMPPEENPADAAARQKFEEFQGNTPMETYRNIGMYILQVLRKEGRRLSIREMQELDSTLGILDGQRISMACNLLVEEGFAMKTVEQRRSYFMAK